VNEECSFSIIIRETTLDPKKITEAIRDLISHYDPNVGIVYVQENENQDNVSYYYDADKYPELAQFKA
jgi:hypothetical protein